MRLGYHTSGLQNHRLGDALELLAELGFRAVAITPDVCHLDPFAVSEAQLTATRAQLTDLGLEPVLETGARFLLDRQTKHEPTLMTADPAARLRRLEFYSRVAAMGARLGARVVSFWVGVDRTPGPDSCDRLRQGVVEACRRIRAEGMQPSLEPEPGMAVATVADWRRLQAELGAQAPALTLDVGHLYVNWEGDPAAICREMVPFLAQVHLEDMRPGVHEHLLPGDGEVDFHGVLTALAEASYSGPVCFELSRASHLGGAAAQRCVSVWNSWRAGLPTDGSQGR